MQQSLNVLTKQIADFFKEKFATEKMNIAAIGNIVSQLHIHVIGRSIGDVLWPDVIWGRDYKFIKYTQDQLKEIIKEITIINQNDC